MQINVQEAILTARRCKYFMSVTRYYFVYFPTKYLRAIDYPSPRTELFLQINYFAFYLHRSLRSFVCTPGVIQIKIARLENRQPSVHV